jgi:hypothetical protein
MLHDLLRQPIRRGQVVEVVEGVEAAVFQPEDLEAGLVAGDEGLVVEIFETLGFLAPLTVGRVVAVDEALSVVALERAGFQGEVFVGAQVVIHRPLVCTLPSLGLASKNTTFAFMPCA